MRSQGLKPKIGAGQEMLSPSALLRDCGEAVVEVLSLGAGGLVRGVRSIVWGDLVVPQQTFK